ncbi:Predicted oxidoreductase, contains short-chain dehydrogenase (SDR) and DUF2520 domains [Malonomonas rubra DSM 5091]|uniref:Predicted oxidoreductase, contains short-chain dehydrogenase (SDR) and DUF2520 domains n=1 Tax=Malonomonas rubra DSM 5091 TaxID=1122189 RepID=A0A1M6M1B8_MALRU|nr:Rossmann-like and DUF2520 domain-containing protein [Malonomonas rubra]SHJ77281.1 Predicted oxidoreductase, contains short-chain dehydrogenase (SDR) and DUF2520 domains [Malonomonas rubra DSM 5091]
MKPSFALIGPGKVGCAVGKQLYLAGYPLKTVVGRTLEGAADGCVFMAGNSELATTDLSAAAEANIILLTTKDGQLAEVAKRFCLSTELTSEQTIIHFSGLLPAEILRAGNCPAAVISIHPLLPFADRKIAAEKLKGCPCAIEGDHQAYKLALDLVTSLGGLPFQIATDKKTLYHAAACIASNFTVTLAATACQLLEDCGIDAAQAPQLLQPLLMATLENFAALGAQQGLTGPIVRGDSPTVDAHISALEKQPQLIDLYCTLARKTLSLAAASGRLSAAEEAKIKLIISE